MKFEIPLALLQFYPHLMLYFELIRDFFILPSYHFTFFKFLHSFPIYSTSFIKPLIRLFQPTLGLFVGFLYLFRARGTPINRMVTLQLIKWTNIMKDNSDIPLPADELRSRVLVFAIIDETTHEYEEITKGYVQISTDEDDKNNTFHYLQVKDQKTNEVLMRSNLKLQNNFGKQKGSIISWTDQEQPQYQEIALSFQKDQQCDMFWRTICEKIGKSYLQINGTQKLQAPNPNNLNYILEKAKNSIDLTDYNIVHSKSIIEGLRQVFYQMKNTNDEMGMGTVLRIINAIMCPAYSSNAIQTLMTGQNFYLLLDLQHFRKNINFRLIYEQKVGQYLTNKFNLPKDIFQKIQLSHRATFYRQNVLNLAEQSLLESMLLMICKESMIEIMSFLNRSKFIDTIIKLNEYPNKSDTIDEECTSFQQVQKSERNNLLNDDKIHFIHQALIMYQQINSQQIKITFKQHIYSSQILKFIKENIQRSNLKALQVLFYINEMERQKFFEYLVEDFKLNSSDNLLKTLMKKYLNQNNFRYPIIAFIQSFGPLFNLKKQLFDFFNGTFLCSVFSVSKDIKCVLLLANTLLAHLENSSILFGQFIKLKICQKIASQYRNGNSLKSKLEQLQMVKFLKHIIIQQGHKGQLKNKEIETNLIESGYFDCCMMIYFKHSQRNNILSSSMLQNLRLLQRLEYSEFDSYLIKEHSQNERLSKILEPIRKKHIDFMNKKANKKDQNDYIQTQRIVHEQILQNQQQDNYLMNEQLENSPTYNHSKDKQISDQNNHKALQTQTNGQQRKQDSLIFLKRMMNELSEGNKEELSDQGVEKQPRKLVKRNEDSKETAMSFEFDLPDMEELNDT